jgi:hypothetical protein
MIFNIYKDMHVVMIKKNNKFLKNVKNKEILMPRVKLANAALIKIF